MNAGAIDFRQLLKEEKKKARQKQRQQQPQQLHDSDTDEKKQEAPQQSLTSYVKSNTTKVQEEDIEAIDFVQLNQQERQQFARRQREKVAQQIQDSQNHAIAQQWTTTLPSSKHQHQVCSNPPSIYYLPQFFPKESDQRQLMEWLQSLPDLPYQPQEQERHHETVGWTTLPYAKRRVAVCSSDHFPPMLQQLCRFLTQDGIIFSKDQPPNHILINEYHPGQGILPHTDGPAYASRTATLSLESSVLIQFTPRPRRQVNEDDDLDSQKTKPSIQQQPTVQLLLEPGSLVVFEDDAYLEYCHGIADRVNTEQSTLECANAPAGTSVTRGYRISLTFRHKY